MSKIIDLNELKKIELRLMSEVDDICKREGLRYSLGGGTLLGAVRHKGFIPWDDDIDIMMPRPDYDAFIAYCATHDTPFAVRSFENDKTYVDLSAKVFDPNTVLEDDAIDGGDKTGVAIDVFVIDGLGDTEKAARKAFKKTSFKRELLVAANWKKFFRSKTHAWYVEPIRFGFFVLSRGVNKSKLFDKIQNTYKKIDFDKAKYAAAVGGAYREREILPQSVFTEYVELPFEDKSFMAIAAYDTYLSSIYGDYMKLPPEEKRVSHHTFTAYYKADATDAGDEQ